MLFYSAPIPVPPAAVVPSFHKTKSAPVTAMANINHQLQFPPSHGTTTATASASGSAVLRPMKRRSPTATLPCVDAIERHELMLLRMGGNTKSQMWEDIVWAIFILHFYNLIWISTWIVFIFYLFIHFYNYFHIQWNLGYRKKFQF
jgi:hypothetical protein